MVVVIGVLVGIAASLSTGVAGGPAVSEPALLTGAQQPERVTTSALGDAPDDAETTRLARTAAQSSAAAGGPEVEEAVPPPVAIEIPTLGVRAEIIDLGLDADGRLEVPEDFDEVGWWAGGPAPGEDGPAVLAGHVDSHEGPAVFWRLRELEPGDEVVVHRADGSARTFVVDGLGRWPKDDFPTDLVYRDADGPELRLATCGGVFDEDARSYLDNVIVFAAAR